jgi:hypothetical protein
MNNARNVASILPPARAEKARASLDRLDAYRAKCRAEDAAATNGLQPITAPEVDRREPPLEGLKRAATGAAFLILGVSSDAPNAMLERWFVIAVGSSMALWGAIDLHRSACNPRTK